MEIDSKYGERNPHNSDVWEKFKHELVDGLGLKAVNYDRCLDDEGSYDDEGNFTDPSYEDSYESGNLDFYVDDSDYGHVYVYFDGCDGSITVSVHDGQQVPDGTDEICRKFGCEYDDMFPDPNRDGWTCFSFFNGNKPIEFIERVIMKRNRISENKRTNMRKNRLREDWVVGKNAGAYKFSDALRKNDFTVEKDGPDEIVVDYGGEKVYVQSILDYWYDYNDERPNMKDIDGKLHFYLDKFPDDKLKEAIHISTLEEIARSLDDISVRKAGLKWRWSPTDYDSLHLVAYNDRIPDEKALMRVLNDAFGNGGILLARDPVIKRLDGDELVTIYNFRCGDWDHKPTVREARLGEGLLVRGHSAHSLGGQSVRPEDLHLQPEYIEAAERLAYSHGYDLTSAEIWNYLNNRSVFQGLDKQQARIAYYDLQAKHKKESTMRKNKIKEGMEPTISQEEIEEAYKLWMEEYGHYITSPMSIYDLQDRVSDFDKEFLKGKYGPWDRAEIRKYITKKCSFLSRKPPMGEARRKRNPYASKSLDAALTEYLGEHNGLTMVEKIRLEQVHNEVKTILRIELKKEAAQYLDKLKGLVWQDVDINGRGDPRWCIGLAYWINRFVDFDDVYKEELNDGSCSLLLTNPEYSDSLKENRKIKIREERKSPFEVFQSFYYQIMNGGIDQPVAVNTHYREDVMDLLNKLGSTSAIIEAINAELPEGVPEDIADIFYDFIETVCNLCEAVDTTIFYKDCSYCGGNGTNDYEDEETGEYVSDPCEYCDGSGEEECNIEYCEYPRDFLSSDAQEWWDWLDISEPVRKLNKVFQLKTFGLADEINGVDRTQEAFSKTSKARRAEHVKQIDEMAQLLTEDDEMYADFELAKSQPLMPGSSDIMDNYLYIRMDKGVDYDDALGEWEWLTNHESYEESKMKEDVAPNKRRDMENAVTAAFYKAADIAGVFISRAETSFELIGDASETSSGCNEYWIGISYRVSKDQESTLRRYFEKYLKEDYGINAQLDWCVDAGSCGFIVKEL